MFRASPGLQQDSAEVLINVLTQLEMAFDPATAEDGAKGSNLISE
jgi:ubiquitin carboxyl-terminal hydrolase 25/28